MKRFDILLSRIAVCGSILVTCAIAFSNPYGPNRASFDTQGIPEELGIFLMAGLALFAIAETVVNDVLPDRFHLKRSIKFRHLLFFMLAGSQIGLIYNNVMAHNYDALLLKYAWDGIISVAVVLADFAARYRYKHFKDLA